MHRATHRRNLALDRIPAADAMMQDCRLCHHDCRANRQAGLKGPCRAGVQASLFSAQTEVSDESFLNPCYAIALNGCDMRCAFCITGKDSWNAEGGRKMNPLETADGAVQALSKGAKSIMILGGEPSIHVPSVLRLVAALPEDAYVIYKTNGHFSPHARELLEGLFDLWLVDFKFGCDSCAHRLAGVSHYTETLQDNLRWCLSHEELMIRHLVMPGHIDCCWTPIASWIGQFEQKIPVNLRSGFWPAWQASRHPDLRRPPKADEVDRARKIASQNHLTLVS